MMETFLFRIHKQLVEAWVSLYLKSTAMSPRMRRVIFSATANAHEQFLKSAEGATIQQLNEYRMFKLRAVMARAYADTPFYRKWFDRYGMTPENVHNITDLSLLPPITKSDLRTVSPQEYCARNMPRSRFVPARTSGSQSEPFVFYFDRKTFLFMAATWKRLLRWYDVPLRAVKILIADPALDRITDYSMRISIFDLFKNPGHAIGTLKKGNGGVLIGYASGLKECAYLAESMKVKLSFPIIISFAEMLFNHEREYIERVFGGKVYNFYGAAEFGIIAQECALRDGFHINEEGFIVEIEKDAYDEDGYGRIIITSLLHEAMPFIRYQIGDLGKFYESACSCGMPSRKIRLRGRSGAVFQSAKRRIHEFEFNNILSQYAGVIRQFEIVPQGKTRVLIKVVAPVFTEGLEREIISQLKSHIDDSIDFVFECVSHIERSSRGKILGLRS